jgi:hypothetical protein
MGQASDSRRAGGHPLPLRPLGQRFSMLILARATSSPQPGPQLLEPDETRQRDGRSPKNDQVSGVVRQRCRSRHLSIVGLAYRNLEAAPRAVGTGWYPPVVADLGRAAAAPILGPQCRPSASPNERRSRGGKMTW